MTLNLEFNRDTADYLAEPAHETMLRAMVGTFAAFYQDHSLDEISFNVKGGNPMRQRQGAGFPPG